MKNTVTLNSFRDKFQCIRPESFSYVGLEVLYDFLEEVDPEMELDVIGLDCDFTEDTIENVLGYYDLSSIEQLHDNTIVLLVDDETIIYQNY